MYESKKLSRLAHFEYGESKLFWGGGHGECSYLCNQERSENAKEVARKYWLAQSESSEFYNDF